MANSICEHVSTGGGHCVLGKWPTRRTTMRAILAGKEKGKDADKEEGKNEEKGEEKKEEKGKEKKGGKESKTEDGEATTQAMSSATA